MLSAWKLLFDGAAFTPAPGVTYTAFRQLFYGRPANNTLTPPLTAMPSLRELKEAHSDAATKDRGENGRLHARLGLVERDCQQWYEEATKVFVEGSEVGDLIRRRVPTTTDYNPPTPAPSPSVPTPAQYRPLAGKVVQGFSPRHAATGSRAGFPGDGPAG